MPFKKHPMSRSTLLPSLALGFFGEPPKIGRLSEHCRSCSHNWSPAVLYLFFFTQGEKQTKPKGRFEILGRRATSELFCPWLSCDMDPEQLQTMPTRGHSFFTKDWLDWEGSAASCPRLFQSWGKCPRLDSYFHGWGRQQGRRADLRRRLSSDSDSSPGTQSWAER